MSAVGVVIFAGGVGSRMHLGDKPKQFLELSGRPIIDYTIERFALHRDVTRIVVSCLESWTGWLGEYLGGRGYPVPIDVVSGGRSGQESIYNGLAELRRHLHGDADAIVLVHDGVRPLITDDTIDDVIESVRSRGATATVSPASETIVTVTDAGAMREVIPRTACVLARAPQGFLLEDLWEAHGRARAEGRDDFVDSVSMMRHYGHDVYTVVGPPDNIKVTTVTDYFAFKGLMEARG